MIMLLASKLRLSCQGWQAAMVPQNKVVFISCGQVTEEERALGRSIAQLIEQLTPFQAYLAQNQSSLEGLTQNILKALNRCLGLIIVMHPRGKVSGVPHHPHTRGSVWIEQEIAIAAFLTQVLHKDLRVAAFIHKDIQREGMRDELQLNPVIFENSDQVLAHLVEILNRWQEQYHSAEDARGRRSRASR